MDVLEQEACNQATDLLSNIPQEVLQLWINMLEEEENKEKKVSE